MTNECVAHDRYSRFSIGCMQAAGMCDLSTLLKNPMLCGRCIGWDIVQLTCQVALTAIIISSLYQVAPSTPRPTSAGAFSILQ